MNRKREKIEKGIARQKEKTETEKTETGMDRKRGRRDKEGRRIVKQKIRREIKL